MAENPVICEATISAETSKRLHAELYDKIKEELEKLARWRLESLGAELWIGRGKGARWMVKLVITKKDIELLLLWAHIAKDQAEEVKLPFQKDEFALIEKLRKARRGGE